MNILIAGQAYYKEDNGQAAFTVRLARKLSSQGHEVMVIAPGISGHKGILKRDGVTVLQVKSISMPDNTNLTLFSGKVLKKAVKAFAPDIIHLQDHYFISRKIFRIARQGRIPVIGTNHFLPENLTANLPLPDITKKPLNWILWKHMLSLYNRLDAVTTPTQTALKIIRDKGLKPDLSAVSNGVDTDFFKPSGRDKQKQAGKKLPPPDSCPVFIFVGRIDREKGLDTVVKAMSRLADRDCRCIIAGKGGFLKELEQMCRHLRVENRVVFPGFIPAEDLPALLSSSACFVMAGFAELQSIATLEAMACGLPVIAADAGALPELVKPDVNGMLFKTQDPDSLARAMDRFLSSPGQWSKWGAQSRKIAEEHSISTTLHDYTALYQRTLGAAFCVKGKLFDLKKSEAVS